VAFGFFLMVIYRLCGLVLPGSMRFLIDSVIRRRQVQAHIGRLSAPYYDANKSGMLVSRIMTAVEGVHNLIGTGLVEFAGGILTAVGSFLILLYYSPMPTALALLFVVVFALTLSQSFRKIRPIFRNVAFSS
jgi:subfamily B ATP-binding cassette protein MsbA